MSNGTRAGKAYVELGIQNNLRRGLAQAEGTLKSWGAKLATAGSIAVGASAAGLSVFGGMAKSFADAGSQVYDLSKRTGISAESLSAMKYAAEQNGSSLQTVAKSMGVVNRLSAQLASGNKGAANTLKQLGINSKEFLAASPEQRFGMIADGLNAIQDEGIRAGMAMKVLGKGGAELLPMLEGGSAGIKALTDKARELGIVITDEGAAKADALGDSWDSLGSVFQGVMLRIGDAVAGPLTQLIDIMTPIVASIGQFVSANQGMVLGIVAGIAAFGAIGGVLVAAGVALTTAGIAVGALVSGFGILVSFITFLVSPLGIFVALIAGGVGYLLAFTDAGNWLVDTLSSGFTDLFGIFKGTFGAIVDALSAGQLELAGKVAFAGFNAAVLSGYATFQSIWSGFKVWFVNLMVDGLNAVVGKFREYLLQIAAMLQRSGFNDLAQVIGGGALFSDRIAKVTKESFAAQENESVKQAQADAKLAAEELARLKTEATVAKDEAARAKLEQTQNNLGVPAIAGMSFGGGGVTSGAFLASAAANLGNTGTSIAVQQLAAMQAGNKTLEEIRDKIDEQELEFGA